MKTGREPHIFLIVGVDIYSKADLQPLVAALDAKVAVLFVGRTNGLIAPIWR